MLGTCFPIALQVVQISSLLFSIEVDEDKDDEEVVVVDKDEILEVGGEVLAEGNSFGSGHEVPCIVNGGANFGVNGGVSLSSLLESCFANTRVSSGGFDDIDAVNGLGNIKRLDFNFAVVGDVCSVLLEYCRRTCILKNLPK